MSAEAPLEVWYPLERGEVTGVLCVRDHVVVPLPTALSDEQWPDASSVMGATSLALRRAARSLDQKPR